VWTTRSPHVPSLHGPSLLALSQLCRAASALPGGCQERNPRYCHCTHPRLRCCAEPAASKAMAGYGQNLGQPLASSGQLSAGEIPSALPLCPSTLALKFTTNNSLAFHVLSTPR
jgi:hypothetical protein